MTDHFGLPTVATEDWWWMPCTGKLNFMSHRIKDRNRQGDKPITHGRVCHFRIQAGQSQLAPLRIREVISNRGMKPSHQERCRNSLPRHITNHDRNPTVWQAYEIIIIPPNTMCRFVVIRKFITIQSGRGTRQKSQLDLSRNFQISIKFSLIQ